MPDPAVVCAQFVKALYVQDDPEAASQLIRPAEAACEMCYALSAELLCSQLTSFVGQAGEIAVAKKRLGETRLLTLTGLGGVGKTRLQCRLPHRCYQRFPVACGLFCWLLSGWRTSARRGGLGDLHRYPKVRSPWRLWVIGCATTD